MLKGGDAAGVTQRDGQVSQKIFSNVFISAIIIITVIYEQLPADTEMAVGKHL